MKPDELAFRAFVLSNEGRIPSDYWKELTKREHYLLEKWSIKGWWDYGVSIRSGWLTPSGKNEFEKGSK